MDYKKLEAKEYAKQHFRGIWAANLTPFNEDLSFNEVGFQNNLKHWIETLKLGGLFINGKMGEFFSMSLAERKQQFQLAVDAAQSAGQRGGIGRAGIITSCSDSNLDTVIDLARYSQDIGADYVIIHSPVLHFGSDTEETIFEYYRHLCDKLDIGIAMWNHPDCGYTMSPELCNRIADLPNIVAIKYSTDRDKYKRLTEMAGHKIQVSNPDEEHWLDNMIDLGWNLYLCSIPPFLLQTAVDQRMNEYTQLAFAGKHAEARKVRDSMNPIRDAIKASKPKGKAQAHGKIWQEMIGQAGGSVRRPLLGMTSDEVAKTREAFAACGLKTV